MNFKEWFYSEARRGPVPGAFGGNKFTSDRREINRYLPIGDRVQYGRGIEDQVYNNLSKCGFILSKPTEAEDKFDKIDGWIITSSGKKALQIKYKDTGDNVVFEVLKDYNNKKLGRDYVSKADYYAVLDQNGSSISVYSVKDIKNVVNTMLNRVEIEGFDSKNNFRMGNSYLKIRPDSSTGILKLMAFIDKGVLKLIQPENGNNPCLSVVKY